MNQALSVMTERLPMKFTCFYETKKTKLGKSIFSFKTLVVDKTSATIDGHSSCSLVSDHPDLNKFSSLKDEKFILVSGALEELVKWSYKFLLRIPVQETLSDKLLLYQVSPSHIFFTGRQDYLEQMRWHFEVDNLRPDSTSQKRQVFVLYGLGGSGKTQLALKFAELYQDCFAERLFIDSSSKEILEDKLVNIAKQMKIGDTIQEALQWITSRARQKSWLLIFDNVDDPSLNLTKYLPDAGNLIITTRNRDCRAYSPEGNMNIGVLPTKDAIDLLFKASMQNQQSSDLGSASELAKELDYLPLAIIQAGAYIRQNSGFSEYLELFRKHREQILRHRNCNIQNQNRDYDLSVYATWDLSYNKLDDSAKYLLKMCAVLHHKDIPKLMFQRGIIEILKGEYKILRELVPGEEYVELAQLENTLRQYWITNNEWDIFKFNDTLAQLTSYSLIDIIEEGHNIYSIHNLVQLWIQDSLKDQRLAIRTGMKMLLCLSINYESSIQEHYYRRQLLPHLLVLSDVNDTEPEVASRAAFVYMNNGLWSKAEEKYLQALQKRKNVLGEEHPDTLRNINSLAEIYTHQGKWENAEALQEQVSESRKRILGEEHPDTLTSTNNLAYLYTRQGQWKKAEVLQKQVLESRERILGEEHPDTLISIHILAEIYLNQGKWEKAEVLQEHVLELSKRILGEEHPNTLMYMSNLAFAYANQGKWEKAEVLQEQVLELSKRILGEEHPSTLAYINNLAMSYTNQGKWGKAKVLQEQVLELSKRIWGEEHPETLLCINNLALSYSNQGKWEKAKVLQEQVLGLSKRILGEEHPDTIRNINNLAFTYANQGRWEKAQEQVLELSKRILGEEHPNILTYMHNLAFTYKNQGKSAQAQVLQEILESRKRISSEEHPTRI